MSLIVNGIEIPNSGNYVKYGNTNLDKVVCNGSTVWEKITTVPSAEGTDLWKIIKQLDREYKHRVPSEGGTTVFTSGSIVTSHEKDYHADFTGDEVTGVGSWIGGTNTESGASDVYMYSDNLFTIKPEYAGKTLRAYILFVTHARYFKGTLEVRNVLDSGAETLIRTVSNYCEKFTVDIPLSPTNPRFKIYIRQLANGSSWVPEIMFIMYKIVVL